MRARITAHITLLVAHIHQRMLMWCGDSSILRLGCTGCVPINHVCAVSERSQQNLKGAAIVHSAQSIPERGECATENYRAHTNRRRKVIRIRKGPDGSSILSHRSFVYLLIIIN